MATSAMPVFSLISRTGAQVAPPSVVLKRPRSPPGAHSPPIAAAYTTSGSRGSIRIWPMCSEVLQPRVGPAPPAVQALVDAVAPADAPLARVLAGPEPDHVGVGGVDRDRAGGVRGVVVEDGRPGGAAVLGLPDVRRGGGDVPHAPVGRVDRHVRDPAGHEGRADARSSRAERRASSMVGGVAEPPGDWAWRGARVVQGAAARARVVVGGGRAAGARHWPGRASSRTRLRAACGRRGWRWQGSGSCVASVVAEWAVGAAASRMLPVARPRNHRRTGTLPRLRLADVVSRRRERASRGSGG